MFLPPLHHLSVITEQIHFIQDLVRDDGKMAEHLYQFPAGAHHLSGEVVSFYLGQLPQERRDLLARFPRYARFRHQQKETQYWLFQLLSYGQALSVGMPAQRALQHERPLAYVERVRGSDEAKRMAREYNLSLEPYKVEDLRNLKGWEVLVKQGPEPERDQILALCVNADPWYTPFQEWEYFLVISWCPLWLYLKRGEPLVLSYFPGKDYDKPVATTPRTKKGERTR